MRRILSIASLAVLALVALPAGLSGARPSATVPTRVVHVRPVDGKGVVVAGYTVTKKYPHGGCQAGSEATGDAYRCFAGSSNKALDAVIDPCWLEKGGDFVACLSSPASFKVAQIHVTKGFDGNPGKKAAKLPWDVQISDGTVCTIAQGAGSLIHGKRVNYFCDHSKTVLYGRVDKSESTWTIRQAVRAGSTYDNDGRATLTKAWFGKPSAKA